MKDPWLALALAILAGGMLGVFYASGSGIWILVLLLLWLFYSIFFWPRDFFSKVYHPLMILLCVSVLTGYVSGWTALVELPEPVVIERVSLTGTLKDWQIEEDKLVGIVRIETIQIPVGTTVSPDFAAETIGGRYRVLVYPEANEGFPPMWLKVQPGDVLRFTARLEQPKASGTPGGFDLRIYNHGRGLMGSLTGRSDAQVVQVGKAPIPWLIRQRVHLLLSAWNPEESGTMEGILFGDTSGIPPEIQEMYKTSGVLHVFAASGSNVAVVLSIGWSILCWVPLRLRVVACIGILMLYAALCGGSAPIMRATILVIAILLGKLGHGRVASLRWLAFAALGLFIQNPVILLDTGFQLSFAAAWGISVLAPSIARQRQWSYLPLPLRGIGSVTLAAQAATLPILIVSFHRVSMVGFVANMVILFILSSVLELGLIAVLLSFLPGLSLPFFQAGLWLLRGANMILERLAALSWADFWIVHPGMGFTFVWYGMLAVLLFGRQKTKFVLLVVARRGWNALDKIRVHMGLKKNRSSCNEAKRKFELFWKKGRMRWATAALLFLFLWHPWQAKNELEIAFLDVGQGDSILIRTPEGHAIMIDTGPRTDYFDTGERILIPYLLNAGIKELDALLLTHEHLDHIGGAPSVLGDITVGWIGVPEVGEKLNSEEWRVGLPESLPGLESKLRELRAGDRIELDSDAWIEVLAPSYVLHGTRSDQNNNSLVLMVHYEGFSVLLGADMEKEEMAEIAASGQMWEADFVKQPHHGSRYSLDETWLDAIHPHAVLISVGKNSFGHPSPEILDYWTKREVPVYRTDEDGTIRLYLESGHAILSTGREVR